jgi:hypothetical protein
MNPIFKETWKQLLRDMEEKRKGRSKKLVSYYRGVSSKGFLRFTTKSQRIPGKWYEQYIRLLDLKDISALADMSKKDITRLMLSGNIAVSCSCPDFLYFGSKFILWNTGAGILRETRFPKIRNPNLEGTVCKHLGTVLQVYMMNFSTIYRDILNSKYYKSKMDDLEAEEQVNSKSKKVR